MTKTDTCRNAGGRGTPDANVRVVFPTTYQVYFSGAAMSQSVTHAMTVAVEDYFHVAACFDLIEPQHGDAWHSRVVPNNDRLLAMVDSAGVKATFFILGGVAERHPDLAKRIHPAGQEDAPHGYSHQFIYPQSPEVFHEECRRSKRI